MIIDKFNGLVNTVDQEKQPLGSLSVANNVMLTRSGTLFRRPGYALSYSGTNITGSYGTTDERYLFLVDNGSLYCFDGVSIRSLGSVPAGLPCYWAEESPESVFLITGQRIVQIEDGRNVTVISAQGKDYTDSDLSIYAEPFVPVNVRAITFHQGSIVVATRIDENLSRIQYTVPGHPELTFKLVQRFEIKDDILGLASVNGRLVIAGRHNIFSYSMDSGLSPLADYGVVPGKPITNLPDSGCLIATTRGICQYPEFQNLTEGLYSYPPGEGASSSLFEFKGDKYLLVCTDGLGRSYNEN